MKLLLDKNFSFRLGGMLEAHGHDVVHVDAGNVALAGPDASHRYAAVNGDRTPSAGCP